MKKDQMKKDQIPKNKVQKDQVKKEHVQKDHFLILLITICISYYQANKIAIAIAIYLFYKVQFLTIMYIPA